MTDTLATVREDLKRAFNIHESCSQHVYFRDGCPDCLNRRAALQPCLAAALTALVVAQQEGERLRGERAEAIQKGERLCNWIGYLLTTLGVSTPEDGVTEVSRRLERLAALELGLRTYGRHAEGCGVNRMTWSERSQKEEHDPGDCNCGLAAALAEPPGATERHNEPPARS